MSLRAKRGNRGGRPYCLFPSLLNIVSGMEAEQPVKQAFGSPGGKAYLAPRIAKMMPPHRIYVEPYAGGAAVFFRKEPSQKEVLGDKDSEIAFAFRFLRDMAPEQFRKLASKNWRRGERLFKKLKTMRPKNDLERFYRFYYLKKASFAGGSGSYNHMKDGKLVTDHLWKVHERLKRTAVHNCDAIRVIERYDSPQTFCYLDPPYPGRAFVGRTFSEWTEDDLQRLTKQLKTVKGRFALSLGTQHARLLPRHWYITKVKVRRRIPSGDNDFNRSYQYEIIATNYKPVVINWSRKSSIVKGKLITSDREPAILRGRRSRRPRRTALLIS